MTSQVTVRSLRDRLKKLQEDKPAFPEFAENNPNYPRTMTEGATNEFLRIISTGNYLETACLVVGWQSTTVHRWLRIGEGREPETVPFEPYITFSQLYNAALALAEGEIVAAWKAEALIDFRAGQALLARRHPERWGKQREEISAETGVQSIHIHIGEREAVEVPLVPEGEGDESHADN